MRIMKRGCKWALVTIIMLAAMIAFAGAVTADEPEGQALPAITVSGEADDGYWIYENTKIQIDATDAKMLFLTVNNADTGEVILDKALHENTQAWRGDSYYGWGDRHQTVNTTVIFEEPGEYMITARGYWGAAATRTDLTPATWTDLGAATPTDLPPEDDPGWQETTRTITVQAENGLPGAATISLNNLTNDEISRGELLSTTVTPAEGLAYYQAVVFATDEEGNATGNSLFSNSFVTETTFRIPTWEMAGDCVLQVLSVIPRHPAQKDEVHFTVAGEAPDKAAWALSKHTVDPDEPFSVSVYIPGAELVYLNVFQGAYSEWVYSYGATIIYDIRLPYGPDTEVFIAAYDQDWNYYPCDEELTVNETADAPTPVVVQFPTMHTAGEDLTFTLQVDESKITKGPITYDARLYEYDNAVSTVTSSDGTVTLTVPWSSFEYYGITEPGTNLTMYVRAHGQGYNAQDVQEYFVLVDETMSCEHRYVPFAALNNPDEATVTVKDGKCHILSGPGREGEICEICGQKQNVTVKTVSLEEPHTDENMDGYCDVCHYDFLASESWTLDGTTLVISMTGNIPDYDSADDARAARPSARYCASVCTSA